MGYEPRWKAMYDGRLFQRGYELPWVREFEQARNDAMNEARKAVLEAHMDEFWRLFDAEMDRHHAEILERYGAELKRLRDDPEFWLRPLEQAEAS